MAPVIKRKAVSMTADDIFGKSASISKVKPEEDADMDEQEEMHEQEEEISEEQRIENEETETVEKRRKELKSMYVDQLKELLAKEGIDGIKKRDDMIGAIIKKEAKARAEKRQQAAKVRAVVVRKKEELEAVSAMELKKLCQVAGIMGNLPKQERIKNLLAQWQNDDGIDKALKKEARDEREEELQAMEKDDLQKLCKKAGISPLIKDVMVDRLVKHEMASGLFNSPKAIEEDAPKTTSSGDVVEMLIAKQKDNAEAEKKQKEEADAAAKRMKELRALPVKDLEKQLSRKGLTVSGKKEDMIVALYRQLTLDDSIEARRQELKKMDVDELSKLLTSKGLKTGKQKNVMVDKVLEQEAKGRQELQAYEAKLQNVAAGRQEQLQGKTGAELKDMLTAKGLPAGVTKEDRIQRLVDAARKDGELDKVVVQMARDARRKELEDTDKDELLKLCQEAGTDPFVKEVMVERILAHEDQVGEPINKKARTSK